MDRQVVLIIGEVFVDTHLDFIGTNGPIVRLGGIFHSARAFSALGTDYALAYYAPSFLENDINNFSCLLKAKISYRLGIIDFAPNVMLVNDSREVGNQGYYNILKDQAKYYSTGSIKEVIKKVQPTDVLVFPGKYDTINILNELKEDSSLRIHIDFHYDSDNLIDSLPITIETLILSTSSHFFKDKCRGNLEGILDAFKSSKVMNYLVKENRGGAYCYSNRERKVYESPAHYVPTMHSVGVGDVYNAVFISNYLGGKVEEAMRLASMCAAKYAETLDFEKFQSNVSIIFKDINEVLKLEGIRLSWEERKSKSIYLAAPDFPNIDTTHLENLISCLEYHNFNARLPIRENGLADSSMTNGEEIELYMKDVSLMEESDLLIAVLLYNDPGTLVELGMFKQMGKPTIIFDPYDICENMFVRHTPDYLCNTLDDVISATYCCLRRKLNG